MSLILPSAECDLGLSLVDKGVLNAITYAGELNGYVTQNALNYHFEFMKEW